MWGDAQMLVVVGSKSPAKVEGASRALIREWPDAEITSVGADSGIAAQPASMEEMIEGAVNRAKGAMRSAEGADYSVGIEGGAYTNRFGTFLGAWAAVLRRDGMIGLGSGRLAESPVDLTERLARGEELGDISREVMEDPGETIRHGVGTIGTLTGGRYTRVQLCDDATSGALSKFINPDFYTGMRFRKG